MSSSAEEGCVGPGERRGPVGVEMGKKEWGSAELF